MSKKPVSRPSARDRILDAAEARLLDAGPTGLVLEAVASDAGVSKGGLLYHFPSKEALVLGITDRMLERFERVQQAVADADPASAGRWTRAYLRSTVEPDGTPADGSGRLMAGILAGIGGDSTRLERVREHFAAWQARIVDDAVDPVRATIVRLAADGLWLSALLGLPQVDKQQAAKVMKALDEFSRE